VEEQSMEAWKTTNQNSEKKSFAFSAPFYISLVAREISLFP